MGTFAARYFGSLSGIVREKMGSGLKSFIQLLHQIHGWTAQTTQANWLKKQFPIGNYQPNALLHLLSVTYQT